VPVVYDQPYASDLPEVALRLGLTQEEVIRIHTQAEFLVYTLGFVPGFPYLGGLPSALHLSRREKPRPDVPMGAVMVGGMQAGIIPMPVISAWYTLGRTPLRLFEPERPDPFLVRTGDRVHFRRIDITEFNQLAGLHTDELLPLVRVPP
jgi:KipI family sensor histidine kinase inhibitor